MRRLLRTRLAKKIFERFNEQSNFSLREGRTGGATVLCGARTSRGGMKSELGGKLTLLVFTEAIKGV
jgi:hypothetical protein